MMIKRNAIELGDLKILIEDNFSDEWEIRVTYQDLVQDRLVVVMRYYNQEPRATDFPRSLRILTHSAPQSTPSWVDSVRRRFCGHGDVTLNQINEDSISDVSSDICFLVFDDCPEPIVSDPAFFNLAASLLKKPAHVIWVCPSNRTEMYQITGLARTAHAENSQLRMITVHTAQKLLEEAANCRLAEVLTICLNRLAVNGELQPEREYRIDADGLVLVPRLHRDKQVNKAIAGESISGAEIEMCPFIDPSKSLILSPGGKNSATLVE